MIVVSALMLPVMIVRFYMGVWQMVFIDLPLIVASFWSISLFYVVAHRELYPKNWKRSVMLLPMLMAVGVALTIINTRAVLEALFGVPDELRAHAEIRDRRPPGQPRSQEIPAAQRLAALRRRFVCGGYFVAMIVFAIQTYNFFAIPFLALFVFGYWWAGFGTLYQEQQGRLRWLKQQKIALSAARQG